MTHDEASDLLAVFALDAVERDERERIEEKERKEEQRRRTVAGSTPSGGRHDLVDRIEQLLLHNHPIAVTDQHQKSLERLWLQQDGAVIPREATLCGIQAKRAELV